MPFISKKQLKEDIAHLNEQLEELKKIVITDELKSLRQSKEEYDIQTQLLSNVKFKVKEARIVQNEETDAVAVRIIYELPSVTIPLDDTGKAEKNPMFYSINALEMLDLKDLEKLSNLFEKAKQIILNKKNIE